MKDLSDAKLWKLCCKGNKNAFEQVYKRHYALLYNYGCKLTSDTELVKDVLHDFFIKLISNYQKFSEEVDLKKYLLLAFRNNLINAFEKKKNLSNPFFLDTNLDIADTTIDEENNIQLRLNIMNTLISKLSTRQQEMLNLYYIKGYSHKEISNILNINYQSSKNLLGRTVAQLREFYLKNTK